MKPCGFSVKNAVFRLGVSGLGVLGFWRRLVEFGAYRGIGVWECEVYRVLRSRVKLRLEGLAFWLTLLKSFGESEL